MGAKDDDVKLCKDCKHAVMPNPMARLQQAGTGIPIYAMPMCGHPDARRGVVAGELLTSCVTARGACDLLGATDQSICWPDAKLFEEKETEEPRLIDITGFEEGIRNINPTETPFMRLVRSGEWLKTNEPDLSNQMPTIPRSWWRRMFGG